MSVLDSYCRSAHFRLDALQNETHEEAWKVAYREAEGFHFYELALGSLVEGFTYIQEINRSWRKAVYCGLEEANDQKDGSVKGLFIRWLDLAKAMEKPILDFERRGYRIEHKANYLKARGSAETAITKWVAPLPARSPLMRVSDVTEEEADELRALLEAPAGSPGKLKIKPRPVPQGMLLGIVGL